MGSGLPVLHQYLQTPDRIANLEISSKRATPIFSIPRKRKRTDRSLGELDAKDLSGGPRLKEKVHLQFNFFVIVLVSYFQKG